MNAILKCGALALLFCAVGAQAGTGGLPPAAGERDAGLERDRKGPPKMFGERMKKELGLTDEQFRQLEENRVRHMKKLEAIRKDLRELRKSFGEELGKGADASRMKKIHSQIKELSAKMADTMFDGMLSVRKVLTPEQLAKFHERMGKRGMKGQGGPDGEKGMPGKGREGMRQPKGGCDCPCMKGHKGPPPHEDLEDMEPPMDGEDEPDLAPPAAPEQSSKAGRQEKK